MPPKKRPNVEITVDVDNISERTFTDKITFTNFERYGATTAATYLFNMQQQKEIFNIIQRRIRRKYQISDDTIDTSTNNKIKDYASEYKKRWDLYKKSIENFATAKTMSAHYQNFIDAYNRYIAATLRIVAEKKAEEINDTENNNNNAQAPTILMQAQTAPVIASPVFQTTNNIHIHHHYYFQAAPAQPAAELNIFSAVLNKNLKALCDFLLKDNFESKKIDQLLTMATSNQFPEGEQLILLYQRLFQHNHIQRTWANAINFCLEVITDNSSSNHAQLSMFNSSSIKELKRYLTEHEELPLSEIKEILTQKMIRVQPQQSYMRLIEKFVDKALKQEELAIEALSQMSKKQRII